ncbi:MAG: glycosyltransferase family 4 protein [Luteolibacter sp.]
MIVRFFHPHMTGVVTQYRQLGALLKQRGCPLTVHTSVSPQAPDLRDSVNEISIKRYRVTGSSETMGTIDLDFKLLGMASHCWSEEQEYPDSLIVFQVTRAMLPKLIELRKRGVQILLACSIFPEFDCDPGWYVWLRWRIGTFMILNRIDGIIVYSSTFVKLYRSAGVLKNKLHVLPFPVDCEVFTPIHSEKKTLLKEEVLGLAEEGIVVVFMGSVIERKGADLLLEAWLLLEKRFPTAKLVFVGPYGERETMVANSTRTEHSTFLDRFQLLLGKLSNRDSVVLTGTVDNPQDYLRSADIFVLPSHLEGMGGVIPEAMACELPCVLTKFDGFPDHEFGTHGEEFIFSDFSSESLADAISQLAVSPDERSRIGKNARRNVLNLFERSKIADGFADVFQKKG